MEAAIKVADSLPASMCIASAVRKENTELLSLAGCKRKVLVGGCGSAGYGIYERDANGDLDLSVCAIVHDVHLLCPLFARSLCFHADVCTVGKLRRRHPRSPRLRLRK